MCISYLPRRIFTYLIFQGDTSANTIEQWSNTANLERKNEIAFSSTFARLCGDLGSSNDSCELLTGMDYVRDNSLVTQREYNYDALGRPTTRDTRYPNRAIHHADAKFLLDLKALCSHFEISSNWMLYALEIALGSLDTICSVVADIYYAVVAVGGSDAYEKAQDKTCKWESCKRS